MINDSDAFVARLVAALRSGKYKQGRTRLVAIFNLDERAFCCQGVACDLLVNDGLMDYEGFLAGFQYDGMYFERLWPADLAVAIGTTVWGRINIEDRSRNQITLVEMNDQGFTFDQIADVIEYVHANQLWVSL